MVFITKENIKNIIIIAAGRQDFMAISAQFSLYHGLKNIQWASVGHTT